VRRNSLRVNCVTARNQGVAVRPTVLAPTSDTADVGCDIVGRMAEA
jgi:hypothetical protein